MSTLITEKECIERPSASQTAEMFGAAASEHYRSEPMPRFSAAVRALVTAYIVAIFALVVLRGIDAALHG